MITEVRIKDIDQFLRILGDEEYQPELDRHRSSFVYRGMSDSSQRMVTSLSRNCKQKQRVLEPSILKNYSKYAVLEDPSLEGSIWRIMISGQHHGLPTRLLDWTHSALIAAHFALLEDDMDELDKHDCLIWRLDIPELHSLLPDKYQTAIDSSSSKVFSIDLFSSLADTLEDYDRDMAGGAMVVIEPPSTEARIVNQYSFFSVVPMDMDDVEGFLDRCTNNTVKYVIDKDLRWRLRDILDSLNISERITFPGLDGLSSWIARHYYVK